MYSAGGGFRNAVDCVRFLASQPNFDNTWVVFYELPNRFSAEPPKAHKIAYAVVLFESSVLKQHGNTKLICQRAA
jgi:hypothetical protein